MLKELFEKRQSCRNFDGDRAVEKEKLQRIMENVALAPSACNSQPYTFTVVREDGLVKEVAKTTQRLGMNKHCGAARAFIVINEENAGILAKTAGRVKDQQYAEIDIGIAAAHLILSAEEEGLSTCMIGWFEEEKLKELLGIAEGKRIRLVVAVGYAAAGDVIRAKKRKPLEKTVIWK